MWKLLGKVSCDASMTNDCFCVQCTLPWTEPSLGPELLVSVLGMVLLVADILARLCSQNSKEANSSTGDIGNFARTLGKRKEAANEGKKKHQGL